MTTKMEEDYRATINYNRGFDLQEKGDLIGAISAYKIAAKYGATDAMSRLGTIFDDVMNGEHASKAVFWYKKGVQNGDASCAWNLSMHYAGLGRRRGYLHWLRVATKMGDPNAKLEQSDQKWWKKRTAKKISKFRGHYN